MEENSGGKAVHTLAAGEQRVKGKAGGRETHTLPGHVPMTRLPHEAPSPNCSSAVVSSCPSPCLCCRDIITNTRDLQEERFFFGLQFIGVSVNSVLTLKQDSLAEGRSGGELLTSWWTGSRESQERHPGGRYTLPGHTHSDPPLSTRFHLLLASQL